MGPVPGAHQAAISSPCIWMTAAWRTTGEVVVMTAKLLLATPRPLTVTCDGLSSCRPRFAGSGVTGRVEMRTATKKFCGWLGETVMFRFAKVATPFTKVVVEITLSTGGCC